MGDSFLLLAPIFLPLGAGMLLFIFKDVQSRAKDLFGFFVACSLMLICCFLLHKLYVQQRGVMVYHFSEGPYRLRIPFVADLTSASFLLIANFLSFCVIVFLYCVGFVEQASLKKAILPQKEGSCDAKAGVSLLEIAQASPQEAFAQKDGYCALGYLFLAALNGIILSGDVFNIFVFFELMLFSSYALILLGKKRPYSAESLHYILLNILGSALFFIAIALLYQQTGTLNLAVVIKGSIPDVSSAKRWMVFGLFFLALSIKMGIWPLNFWVIPLYKSLPSYLCVFFILSSKVAVYLLLRLVFFVFLRGDAYLDERALFSLLLFYSGAITLAVASLGILRSKELLPFAGYYSIGSSATMVSLIALKKAALLSASFYYLFSSLAALGGFFLLTALINQYQKQQLKQVFLNKEQQSVASDAALVDKESCSDGERCPHDEEKRAFFEPLSYKFVLGFFFFLLSLLLIGIPPFSGFLAKFLMLHRLVSAMEDHRFFSQGFYFALIFLILFWAFSVLLFLTRKGMKIFCTGKKDLPQQGHLLLFLPTAMLLFFALLLTLSPSVFVALFDAAAQQMLHPKALSQAVLQGASQIL